MNERGKGRGGNGVVEGCYRFHHVNITKLNIIMN